MDLFEICEGVKRSYGNAKKVGKGKYIVRGN